MTLFQLDQYGYPHPVISATRRRTIRNNKMLDRGVHPVTRRPLLDPEWGYTCSDCAHCFRRQLSKVYFKCDLNATGGPATDTRLSWPACNQLRIEI